MALTKIGTDGFKDDAVTTDKLANAINTERTANTAKVSTTINNNADNRVITGSGTANTLEGESGLTYNGSSNLTISGSGQQDVLVGSTDAGGASIALDGDSNGDGAGSDYALIRHNTDGNLEITTKNPTGAGATIFTQGTAESMRVTSSGQLLIGTTSTSGISDGSDDIVIGSIGDSTERGLTFATTGTAAIRWADAGDNAMGRIQYSNSTDVMTVHTANVQRLRVDADGLKFGSDSAAANALDDYEEGTYTISDASGNGITYTSNNTARYIKIGPLVYVQFDVTLSNCNNQTTQDAKFNLPFTFGHDYGSGPIGWTSIGRPAQLHIASSGAAFMDNSSAGNSSKHLINSELNNHRFIGSFHYLTT